MISLKSMNRWKTWQTTKKTNKDELFNTNINDILSPVLT